MIFSKKVLIGSAIALATTTVVVGTTLGVTLSQNTNADTTPQETSTIKPQPIAPSSINLQNLLDEITSETVVIKSLEGEFNDSLDTKTVYAFNVTNNQIALSNTVNVDKQKVEITFDLNSSQNTVANLNAGKLSIDVTLKEKEVSESKEISKTITLQNFKKANPKTDFAGLLNDDDAFVLTINPDSENAAKYIDLDSLNNQLVDVIQPSSKASIPSRSVRGVEDIEIIDDHHGDEADEIETANRKQPVTEKTTALTNWLNTDSTKVKNSTDVKIEGLVKVEKLSGESEKVYFHLVSKDTNNRIKLVKTENKETKEVLLSEIKTTNLLASDVSVKPTNIDIEKHNAYLASLAELMNDEQHMNKMYLTNQADSSLNRKFSIDLSSNNKLFVKPHVTNWLETQQTPSKIPLSITVSFGSGDNVTSFTTTKKEELDQLKKAGFKFGLFTKKLERNDNPVDASVFETMKADLEMYFKSDNYTTPITRPGSNSTYPGDFKFAEISNNNLETDLNITFQTQTPNQSQNWLAFADYSYNGVTSMKVLFTPSISLIRIDVTTPVN